MTVERAEGKRNIYGTQYAQYAALEEPPAPSLIRSLGNLLKEERKVPPNHSTSICSTHDFSVRPISVSIGRG